MITEGWWKKAQRLDSPNYNARPEAGEINLLVIHNISLPPDKFGGDYVQQFFMNQLDCSLHPYFKTIENLKVSAHCFIDRGGVPYQFVSFDQRAWHAGASSFAGRNECNDYSIGVELEGSDTLNYTDEQYACLCELTQGLFEVYSGIVPDRIVGHSDIAPGRKTDPGPAFDWSRYRRSLGL